jgi:undecaprenyl-diphosphatase
MKNEKPEPLRMGPILMILGSSLMIFASLAEDVLHHEGFSTLDPILGNQIITGASKVGDQIFGLITFYGNVVVIIIGTMLLGLWLLKRKRLDQLIFLDAAVGGAALLNFVLKQLFARPRPDYPQAYLTASGFSFPSGHAMISIAFYGAIAYLACSYLKSLRAKLLVSTSALVISGLIGFSRLYLGVHYISDVLAGWAAGIAWLSVCILVDQLYRWKAERRSLTGETGAGS